MWAPFFCEVLAIGFAAVGRLGRLLGHLKGATVTRLLAFLLDADHFKAVAARSDE